VNDQKKIIYNYVYSNLLYGDTNITIAEDDSLIDSGILDSVAVLEFVEFLESEFHIEISDEDLIKKNFDSIEAVIDFLDKKKAATYTSYEGRQ